MLGNQSYLFGAIEFFVAARSLRNCISRFPMRIPVRIVALLLVHLLSGCRDVSSRKPAVSPEVEMELSEVENLLTEGDDTMRQLLHADELFRHIMTILPEYYEALGTDVHTVFPEGFVGQDANYNGATLYTKSFGQVLIFQPKVLSQLRRRLSFADRKVSNVCFEPLHLMMMTVRLGLSSTQPPEREKGEEAMRKWRENIQAKQEVITMMYDVSQLTFEAHLKTRHAVGYLLLFRGLVGYFGILEPSEDKVALAVKFLETYVLGMYLMAPFDPKDRVRKGPFPSWHRWTAAMQVDTYYLKPLQQIEHFIALGPQPFKDEADFEYTVLPLLRSFFKANEKLWSMEVSASRQKKEDHEELVKKIDNIAKGLKQFAKDLPIPSK